MITLPWYRNRWYRLLVQIIFTPSSVLLVKLHLLPRQKPRRRCWMVLFLPSTRYDHHQASRCHGCVERSHEDFEFGVVCVWCGIHGALDLLWVRWLNRSGLQMCFIVSHKYAEIKPNMIPRVLEIYPCWFPWFGFDSGPNLNPEPCTCSVAGWGLQWGCFQIQDV